MIYVQPEVYEVLDQMTTDLRTIIQSRACPDEMLWGLRCTLATLLVAVTDTVPEPKHTSPSPTWPFNGPEGGSAA